MNSSHPIPSLRAWLGHPRTLLCLSPYTSEIATQAKRLDAYVTGVQCDTLDTSLDIPPYDIEALRTALHGQSFDLVWGGWRPQNPVDMEAWIQALVGYVAPEGRILLTLPTAEACTQATTLLERLGLQKLNPTRREACTLRVIARRLPLPGPLSLTVGMLTMNEEESIERMIEEIRQVAPDAQILCIDSSSDSTPVRAEKFGARVIRQLPPRGHGPAMEVLLYEAAKQSDALIYLDCDFTYPPAMIPVVRRTLEEGVDVVNASRTWKRPDAMPLPNYLANRVFATAGWIASGVPASDLHSGMRGYRSSLIRGFDFSGEGDAIPIDTLLWPAKCGYRVVEMPIDYQERVGVSKLRKLAGTVWTFLRLARSLRIGMWGGTHYEVRTQAHLTQ